MNTTGSMSLYAQCFNGTTRFYPGLDEPDIIYKETGYDRSQITIFYANSTSVTLRKDYYNWADLIPV